MSASSSPPMTYFPPTPLLHPPTDTHTYIYHWYSQLALYCEVSEGFVIIYTYLVSIYTTDKWKCVGFVLSLTLFNKTLQFQLYALWASWSHCLFCASYLSLHDILECIDYRKLNCYRIVVIISGRALVIYYWQLVGFISSTWSLIFIRCGLG